MNQLDLATRLRQQADELEAVQRQSALVKIPPKPSAPLNPSPSLQELVAAEVAKHIAPPNPMTSMLALVGQAFNSEQQLWISANLNQIPSFIQSGNGKAALGMLLEEFQNFVKEK